MCVHVWLAKPIAVCCVYSINTSAHSVPATCGEHVWYVMCVHALVYCTPAYGRMLRISLRGLLGARPSLPWT